MASWLYAWRWPVWVIYGLLWTVALLMPVPETAHGDTFHFSADRKFLIAKTAHVSAYIAWAALTGWLRAPARYRFALMFLLMGHATLTEVLQHLTALGRTGALMDVTFDHVGIAVGTLALWKWWASPDCVASGRQ